jgi:uncharacterized protein
MAEVRIAVRVKPGSSRARVGGSYGDGELVVAVNAPPVDGAANEAVLRAVSDALGLRMRQVRLVSGQTTRSKVLALDVADGDEATIIDEVDQLMRADP